MLCFSGLSYTAGFDWKENLTESQNVEEYKLY